MDKLLMLAKVDTVEEEAAELAAGVLGIIIVVYLGLLMLLLINYILVSLGVYKIAKNHNVTNAGLAWIPVGREYVKGAIVDYHSKNKRKFDSKWRVKLPLVTALPIVVVWVMYVVMIVMMVTFGTTMSDPALMNEMTPDEFMMATEAEMLAMVPMLIVIFVFYFLAIICATLTSICTAICDYKIYEEIVPKRAFIYTILSYLVPFAQGICLLCCNKYGTGETYDANDMTFGGTASANEPAPVAASVAPVIEETAPVIEEVAPVVENVAPVVEETAPVVEESEPAPIEYGETEILTPPEETSNDTEIFTE